MAKGKRAPDKSKIDRSRPPMAYSKRQKGSGGPAADDEADDEAEDKAEAKASEPAASGEPAAEPGSEAEARPTATAEETAAAIKDIPPVIEPPPSTGEPWPDATPQPMRPVEPARARTETVAMPAELESGAPPAMPADPGSVEDPTFMPKGRDVPAGNPGDPALPPGRVPSGDSRSMRMDNEFALIYRVGTAVITRFGTVGTRGQWRVVDYPTSSSASNAYAKEVSRFVAEGFSDYRD